MASWQERWAYEEYRLIAPPRMFESANRLLSSGGCERVIREQVRATTRLLRLRIWEELSHADIAAAVGLSARGVRPRLARVRKKLAGMLEVPTSDWVMSPRHFQEGDER